MKVIIPIAYSAALLFAAPLVSASAPAAKPAENRIECPAELPEDTMKIITAPDGWTPSIRSGLLLHSVDISDGPPAERAFLKPDTSRRHGTNFSEKWIELNTARTSHGAWIACNYGDSNSATLGRRLSDTVTQCTVTYGKDPQRGTTIDVNCK